MYVSVSKCYRGTESEDRRTRPLCLANQIDSWHSSHPEKLSPYDNAQSLSLQGLAHHRGSAKVKLWGRRIRQSQRKPREPLLEALRTQSAGQRL